VFLSPRDVDARALEVAILARVGHLPQKRIEEFRVIAGTLGSPRADSQ
jgi:hypothetical protein